MDLGLTRPRLRRHRRRRAASGRATAEALVADGARVVVSGRSAESVADAAVGRARATRAVAVVADNADPATPGAAGRRRPVERYGRLDGALITVGGPPPGPVTDDHRRAVDRRVRVGVPRRPAARPARSAAELGDGRLDRASCCRPVGAVADRRPGHLQRPAAGLAMVAKTLADELGPRGIRVNGLLPGRVDTDRVRRARRSRPATPTAARRRRPRGDPAAPLRRARRSSAGRRRSCCRRRRRFVTGVDAARSTAACSALALTRRARPGPRPGLAAAARFGCGRRREPSPRLLRHSS